MQKFDYPPIWLVGFLAVTAGLWYLAPGIAFHFDGHREASFLMLVIGLVPMFAALGELRRAHTTIKPRDEPDALVTAGVFSVSRNPIYLGLLIILAAGIMYWGSYLALLLLPVFYKVITVRFIEGEEAMMRQHFGAAFDSYAANTGRWL